MFSFNAEEIVQRIIRKKAMSVSEAFGIFDLDLNDEIEVDELNRIWKEKAKAFHTDKGGDLRQIQDLNAAHDIVKDYALGKAKKQIWQEEYEKRRQERAAEEAKKHEEIKKLAEELKTRFKKNKQKYIGYFEKNTGVKDIELYVKTGRSFSTLDFKFRSPDKTEFSIEISISKDWDEKVSYYTTADTFYERKSIRMTRSRFNSYDDPKVFDDPKKHFPAAKLKKIFATDGKSKKLTKKDAIATLVKEFHVKAVDNGRWRMETPDETKKVILTRSVFMRQPVWNFSLFHYPNKYSGRFYAFPQDNKTYMETFEELKEAGNKIGNFNDLIEDLEKAKKGTLKWKSVNE